MPSASPLTMARPLPASVRAKASRRLHALRRGVAAADDGEAAAREEGGVAAYVEYGWRIGDLEQARRVVRIAEGDDVLAGLLSPLDAAVDGLAGVEIEQGVGPLACYSASREAAGGENRFR
jgi:hypothetical protein